MNTTNTITSLTDVLTDTSADLLLGSGDMFCLWFKNGGPWELVYRGSEQQRVNAVGIGGRRGGRWIVLPAGREP